MRRGIEREASPSASSFMSSRRPLRTSLLNSSGVKGRLGSSSIGLRIRGPKNHRTRLASRRMSIPSRQQQTFESAYCSSCRMEIARGSKKAARKISRGNSLLRLLRVSRQSRRSARTRRCFHNPNERPSRQSCRRDRLSRRRSTAHAAARLDQRFEFDLKISLPVLPTALQLQHASGCRCDARNLC